MIGLIVRLLQHHEVLNGRIIVAGDAYIDIQQRHQEGVYTTGSTFREVRKLEDFRGNLMLVRRRRRGPGLLGLTLATIVGIAGGYYIWKPAFEELRKGQ